jgi:HPt (histidine-containing phosphotransfer) domain-containing protein
MCLTNDIFNFDSAVQLVGGKREIAKEIIDSFVENYLPLHVIEMKQAVSANDFEQLFQAVHKFHGALCYCGFSKLESATAVLEKALSQKNSKRYIYGLCDDVFEKSDVAVKAYKEFFSGDI